MSIRLVKPRKRMPFEYIEAGSFRWVYQVQGEGPPSVADPWSVWIGRVVAT